MVGWILFYRMPTGISVYIYLPNQILSEYTDLIRVYLCFMTALSGSRLDELNCII